MFKWCLTLRLEDSKLRELQEEYPEIKYAESRQEIPERNYESAKKRIEDGLKHAIGVVIYNSDNEEILLVKNRWSNGWVIPGGGVEPEEDFEDAVIREVEEETGIEVEPSKPLRIEKQEMHCNDRDPVSNYFIIYLAQPNSREVGKELGKDDNEIEEAEWFKEIPENTQHREALKKLIQHL